MDKTSYEQLCQEIWRHNRLYYLDHAPEISDEEYDALLRRLERIENEHPDWISASSPTQRVNESLTEGFKAIPHQIPMLSLANTYSKEEIEDFIQRIQKNIGNKPFAFAAELKMDGIAISARFEKGQFVKGVTRGDGWKGDDITMNMRTIQKMPLHLYGSHVPEHLEIRGEVFMPHAVFYKLNEEKSENGEPLWANPRNAAAGSLKLLDPKEVAKRELSIAFYSIAEDSSGSLAKQSQVPAFLKSLGLPVLEHHAQCQTIEEIWEFAEKIRALRQSMPYDIDGIVIKLDDIKEQIRLGNTAKNPRWAIAYKFAATQASTQIVDIIVQVGRTGVLTPVAELNPVFLAGSTIARATLHNIEEVQRKDIRVGDTVIIEKGGDVIPKVVSVELAKRPLNSHAWEMPSHCPSCGTPVVKIEDEVAVRCPNEEKCFDQVVGRLQHFAGKHAMDINHMGEKVVLQLFQKGFVKHPSDIYYLSKNELSEIQGFKEKSIENLLKGIEESKKVTLDRLIMALGIKYVGTGTAELLAGRAGSIQRLAEMTEEELKQIDGIGEKVAEAVVHYFSNPLNLQEIERLFAGGVTPEAEKTIQFTHHPFNSKNFVLTGSLENYTRTGAASLIKERGGKVVGSVSKNTDYILAGEDPGSKLEKAKQLGIAILSEKEFISLL